ncbi:MAG: hypothetical protein GY716_15790 [bacterium]|nr:hypothetical protein [bacterium]
MQLPIDEVDPVAVAIYKAYQRRALKEWRQSNRLGASILGKDCVRELWYSHHWVTKWVPGGQLKRLFDTGHIEEDRVIADLRAAGYTVWETDPDSGFLNEETGEIEYAQWMSEFCGKHAVSYADGKVKGHPHCPDKIMALEIKSANKKQFDKYEKDGLRKWKPTYYSQCQLAMHGLGLDRCLFVVICKDDERYRTERVRYDMGFCEELLRKAAVIIGSPDPPPGISEDPSNFGCKFCDQQPVCQLGTQPLVNCRTCVHSRPVHDSGWHCELAELRGCASAEIPLDVQGTGCTEHVYIPALVGLKVAGAEAGAADRGCFIDYELSSGTLVRNGYGGLSSAKFWAHAFGGR